MQPVRIRPNEGSWYRHGLSGIGKRVQIDPDENVRYMQGRKPVTVSDSSSISSIPWFYDPSSNIGHQLIHYAQDSKYSPVQFKLLARISRNNENYDLDAVQIAQGRAIQNRAKVQLQNKIKSDNTYRTWLTQSGIPEDTINKFLAVPRFFTGDQSGLQQFRDYHAFLSANPKLAALLGGQANRRSVGYMNLRNRRADIQKQIAWKQKYRQAPAIRNNKQ